MASLESALKQAVQLAFQLEENELASEPLPGAGARRLILLYESAEGGAGVLRRLVDDPDAVAAVARRALEICHYDPVTGLDRGGPGNELCEAACYDCLMSYRNQPDHGLLDRMILKPVLELLAASTVTGGGASGLTPAAHAGALATGADSALEKAWLSWLEEQGYRLPDRAQPLFEQAGSRPDFAYDEHYVVVYVDGPHHEYPDRVLRDAEQDAAMRDLGYRVIRFGYRDDWAQIAASYRDVFGVGVDA